MIIQDQHPARSITKSVTIDQPPEAVFEFVADGANWPQFAVINVQATRPSSEPGWWDMDTPRGPGRLRIHSDQAHGILDHEFQNDEAHWLVPARVVANGRGAEFMMTFFQPPALADDVFAEQISLVDIELAKLKEILERPAGGKSSVVRRPDGGRKGRCIPPEKIECEPRAWLRLTHDSK